MQYDSLGREIKTIDSIDGPNVRIICKIYDLLDRVVEERIEDQHGEIFKQEQYGYDVDGNKISTTLFTQAGKATTETKYYPNGKPSCMTDALSNQTYFFYDYAFSYRGQSVLKVIKVDPRGTSGNYCI